MSTNERMPTAWDAMIAYVKLGKWTKGSTAVDSNGWDVDTHSERAVKFCLLGMLDRFNGQFGERAILFQAINAETWRCGCGDSDVTCIDCYNDRDVTTARDILRVLRRAKREEVKQLVATVGAAQ